MREANDQFRVPNGLLRNGTTRLSRSSGIMKAMFSILIIIGIIIGGMICAAVLLVYCFVAPLIAIPMLTVFILLVFRTIGRFAQRPTSLNPPK